MSRLLVGFGERRARIASALIIRFRTLVTGRATGLAMNRTTRRSPRRPRAQMYKMKATTSPPTTATASAPGHEAASEILLTRHRPLLGVMPVARDWHPANLRPANRPDNPLGRFAGMTSLALARNSGSRRLFALHLERVMLDLPYLWLAAPKCDSPAYVGAR